MRNIWRHTGKIMTGIGVFHVLIFIALLPQAGMDIIRAGVFNTIGTNVERGLLWYGGCFAGVLMILVGLLMTSWTRTTGRPVPRYFAVALVVAGVVLVVLDPVSGGWLILILGTLALVRPRDTQ